MIQQAAEKKELPSQWLCQNLSCCLNFPSKQTRQFEPIQINRSNLNTLNFGMMETFLSYCQALVPNPKPISPQSLQTQSQPSSTQFETQINPKGTGADSKIL